MGQNVSVGTLERIGNLLVEHDTTIRGLLDDAKSGQSILGWLIDDGVIAPTQISQYFDDQRKVVTKSGKNLVESMVLGAVIKDADLLEASPGSLLGKIEKALPSLAKIMGRGEEWDLTGDLRQALALAMAARKDFQGNVDDYLSQVSFTDDKDFNDRTIFLAKALNEMKPTEFATAMKQYAADAVADVKGQEAIFEQVTPEESFREWFAGNSELMAAERRKRYNDDRQLRIDFLEFGHGQQESFVSDSGTDQGAVSKETPRVPVVPGRLRDKGGPPNTLASELSAHLLDRGYVDLRGSVVSGPKDIAVISQIFRDQRVETLRIFYLKNGVVVGHEDLSSRMPGFVRFFPKNRLHQEIFKIKQRIARLGADSFYFLHNHPSGHVEPSQEDIDFTSSLASKLETGDVSFGGHVIIDHKKYSHIYLGLSGGALYDTDIPIPEGSDLGPPSRPHDLLGLPVSGHSDVARYAAMVSRDKNQVTLLYLRGADGGIRAIQNVPVGILKSSDAGNYLRGRAREFGAVNIAAYIDDIAALGEDQAKRLVANNSLLDVVHKQGSVRRGHRIIPDLTQTFGRPSGSYLARRVAEPSSSFDDIASAPETLARLRQQNFDDLSKADQNKLLSEAQRQVAAVKEVRNQQGELLAPNGEPSRLAKEHGEHLWKMVRTPWFKEWFGEWETLEKQQEISSFIDNALSSPNPQGEIVLRPTLAREINDVINNGGPDISGMEHVLDAQRIRHAYNTHSDINENVHQPGQRPLTKEDIKRIPEIINEYDELSVKRRGANKSSIVYGKHFSDGEVQYVERIIETSRKHKPRLVTRTVWVKALTGVESSLTRVYTPERNINIPASAMKVNPSSASKIVDENGEPLVVYHGTDWNQGTWSSRDKRISYSTGRQAEAMAPGQALSLADIQDVFKGQKVQVQQDGSIRVETANGKQVTIHLVEQITPDRLAFQLGYGREQKPGETILGAQSGNRIEIQRTAGGKWTLREETAHWIEKAGLINPLEIALLRQEVKRQVAAGKWTPTDPKDVGGLEDRGKYIAEWLTRREEAILVKYVGWGGMPEIFSYSGYRSFEETRNANALLKLLTEEEYKASLASISALVTLISPRSTASINSGTPCLNTVMAL